MLHNLILYCLRASLFDEYSDAILDPIIKSAFDFFIHTFITCMFTSQTTRIAQNMA